MKGSGEQGSWVGGDMGGDWGAGETDRGIWGWGLRERGLGQLGSRDWGFGGQGVSGSRAALTASLLPILGVPQSEELGARPEPHVAALR